MSGQSKQQAIEHPIVKAIPLSYKPTLRLEFIDGVLHQMYVSGHTDGAGVWLPVAGQDKVAPQPVTTQPIGTTPAPQTDADHSATGAPVPTEHGMQAASQSQAG